jgi:hypothetical protein
VHTIVGHPPWFLSSRCPAQVAKKNRQVLSSYSTLDCIVVQYCRRKNRNAPGWYDTPSTTGCSVEHVPTKFWRSQSSSFSIKPEDSFKESHGLMLHTLHLSPLLKVPCQLLSFGYWRIHRFHLVDDGVDAWIEEDACGY